MTDQMTKVFCGQCNFHSRVHPGRISPLLPFVWTDAAAANFSTRFYRVQLSP